MARVKNPENTKTARAGKKAQAPTHGNGHAVAGNGHVVAADLEREIRVRAYEIFSQRGPSPGSEMEDWILAEKEVKAKRAVAGA